MKFVTSFVKWSDKGDLGFLMCGPGLRAALVQFKHSDKAKVYFFKWCSGWPIIFKDRK